MIRVSRILRDYTEAGSLNALLMLWGFVDDHVFITKGGDVGLVYRLGGVDYECCDHTTRRLIVNRFASALRVLDDNCRVYQYLIKRRTDPFEAGTCTDPVADEAIKRRVSFLNDRRAELYDLDLYIVIMLQGVRPRGTSTGLRGIIRDPRQALKEWLSTPTTIRLLEEEIDRAVAQLYHKTSSFEVQLADGMRPERLGKSDAYRFMRRLLNYAPHKVNTPLWYDTRLDYFVSDSHLECDRDHLTLDDQYVKVLTMKEPPSHTFAHILEDLYTVAGEFIACLEWQRIPSDRMRKDIKTRQRHFFNKRVSMMNHLSTSEARPESEMLVDSSADMTVKQLGDALTQLEVRGHTFGECSLTLILHDQDRRAVERASAEAIKVLASHDGQFVEETYNQINAWLAVVPGNHRHNLRRLALLDVNCADLSFLFTLDRGEPHSGHLGRESLAIFETNNATPYAWNLHYHDVGHTLVLGATGSGKSFFLNFMVMMAQKYEPFTVVLDLGHSYRKLSTLLKGSYLELGLHYQGVRLNPFAFAPTPEHLHFLHAFVKVLLEGRGSERLTDAEDRALYDGIVNLYVLNPEHRRLLNLGHLIPRGLTARGESLNGLLQPVREHCGFDH